jgi:hypothetical protein
MLIRILLLLLIVGYIGLTSGSVCDVGSNFAMVYCVVVK